MLRGGRLGGRLHRRPNTTRPGDIAEFAARNFNTANPAQAGVNAALEVAEAGLSQISVVVQRNETLDQIFRRLELSLTDLANLRAISGARAALDQLRPGDLLTLVHRGGELVGLERPLSITQTLKVSRDADDGFVANVEEVPLTRETVTATGEIESSLFAAGTAVGLRDATTMELAEIFRWDIDFVLDLREGDSFKVIYEQLQRDGKNIGDGEILAAEFMNDGTRVSRRALRECGRQGRLLHAGRQEPAQGLPQGAGAVLAHQLDIQSQSQAPHPQPHPRASRRRLCGAHRHTGARRRRRPRAVSRREGRLRQRGGTAALGPGGHALRSPVAVRQWEWVQARRSNRARSSVTWA